MVFQFPRETQRSSPRRLPFRQERNHKDSSRAPTRMGCPIASLPSLLFLSTASSSRLMTLRFVTAGALDDFSTGILSSTHVLSPHPSIVYSAFPKINLLAIVPHFLLRQAIKGATYKGIAVDMTGLPKKKTSLNIEEDSWKQWFAIYHSEARIKSESERRNGQSCLRINEKVWS
jgi:hypothetical protein